MKLSLLVLVGILSALPASAGPKKLQNLDNELKKTAGQSGSFTFHAPSSPSLEITEAGPFYLMNSKGEYTMICKNPVWSKTQPSKMIEAKDCELQGSHTLDEIMTGMVWLVNYEQDNAKEANEKYLKELQKEVKMLQKFQRELNHGIPLKQGEPKS